MPTKFSDLVLKETEDFIFINKPYGVSSLDDRTSPLPSILALAKTEFPDAILSHRLDKETSGVMLIAKNEAAYRHSSILFEHREVNKVYHAFVNGTHRFENKIVDVPLHTLNNGKVVTEPKEGKPSTTIFNTLKAFKFVTLVQCQPLTGRMHQIRVHLAYLNAPIVADDLYGGKPVFLSHIKRKFNLKKEEEERPLISRVALHARSLTFALPNGEQIMVEAPYPKDMSAFLQQLEKNS